MSHLSRRFVDSANSVISVVIVVDIFVVVVVVTGAVATDSNHEHFRQSKWLFRRLSNISTTATP